MLILSLLAVASVTIIVLKAVVNNLWHISHKHTNMIITTVLFFLIFILFNGSDKLFATWWKLLLWKYLIPHSSLTFLLILVNSNISGVRLNIMNFINFFQNKLGYFIFFSKILCHAQSLRTPCVCYLSLKQSLVFWKILCLQPTVVAIRINTYLLDCTSEVFEKLGNYHTYSSSRSSLPYFFDNGTAWIVFVFGVVLVRICPHSGWIRRDTPYLSVFNRSAGKWGLE